VLPLLLSMTLFANNAAVLSFLLLLPTGIVLLRTPRPDSMMPLAQNPASNTHVPVPKQGSLPPLPALTTYRAHMMLMTILGILAVDFPVFPRSLAKCETYGVSLVAYIAWKLCLISDAR
jgi:phosphatidylinositol glycan class W